MEALDSLLEEFPVVVLLNDFSPFCLKVQGILESYTELEQDKVKYVFTRKVEGGAELEKAAASKARTAQVASAVPYLFIKGTLAGGCQDVIEMHASGQLENLLVDSTALRAPDLKPLHELVTRAPVVLITNTFSPFCLEAQSILESYAIPQDKLLLFYADKEADSAAVKEGARYECKERELPYAYIGGVYVGSVETLSDLHAAGALESILVESAALKEADFGLLDHLLAANSVVLVGNMFSPFCLSAKDLLAKYNVLTEASTVDVDNREDGMEIWKAARCRTKTKKLPFVFIGGEYVGKYEDLEQLHNTGELEKRLIQGNALEAPSTTGLTALINQYEILLLTNSFSPFCLETQHLLEEKYKVDSTKLETVDIDAREDGEALKNAARFMTGQKQMPYLFIHGRIVNPDRNSLAKMEASGELETMLRQALVLS